MRLRCVGYPGHNQGRSFVKPWYKPSHSEAKMLSTELFAGVFLGAGSVSNPESAYHLEISINDLQYASFSRAINRI